MRVQELVQRLAAAAPEVLIVYSMPMGKIVHAVRDEEGEARREVFVMSGRTWSRVEIDASLLSSYVGNRWRVRRAKDVGRLSLHAEVLALPLSTRVDVVGHDIETVPSAIMPRREWIIQLR
jgi:hypothetical protein